MYNLWVSEVYKKIDGQVKKYMASLEKVTSTLSPLPCSDLCFASRSLLPTSDPDLDSKRQGGPEQTAQQDIRCVWGTRGDQETNPGRTGCECSRNGRSRDGGTGRLQELVVLPE